MTILLWKSPTPARSAFFNSNISATFIISLTMSHYLLICSIIIGVVFSFEKSAECAPLPPVRFKDLVYMNVSVQQNITYVSDSRKDVKQKYYLLDFYEPAGDTSTLRPLIIWIHGGGFKFGKKTSRGIPLWSKAFAQKGYACAAINYRLSKKNPLSKRADLIEACLDAMEDVRKVIEFFRKNATQYRIDVSKIILAGNSAGGIIALQSVYSNQDLMKHPDQPDANSPTNPKVNPDGVVAVINFWGALLNIDWLSNAGVPIVSVHGDKDKIVPPGNSEKGLFGSVIIHREADNRHIPNQLKIYTGFAHELQKGFNPLWAGRAAKKRWREAGEFAADFLYAQLFE